jgi:hypothetical protein
VLHKRLLLESLRKRLERNPEVSQRVSHIHKRSRLPRRQVAVLGGSPTRFLEKALQQVHDHVQRALAGLVALQQLQRTPGHHRQALPW